MCVFNHRFYGRWSARRVFRILYHCLRVGVPVALRFRRPARLFRYWLKRDWTTEDPIELRNGLKLACSHDPDDIVTLLEVFVERCYGEIPRGSTVVDVGANIGVFALYAAQRARKVIAYEPSAESFNLLVANIRRNRLEEGIEPRLLAVSDQGGQILRFPVASSRGNRPVAGASDQPFREVGTTTLTAIIGELRAIDVLKLDCEGAEREIILSTPVELWTHVRTIRMEYHEGLNEILTPHLMNSGFRLTMHAPNRHVRGAGTLWFTNQNAAPARAAGIS